MSFADHVEAIKKEMTTMSSQIGQNKTDLERSRQEIGQIQLQLQQVNGDPAVQAELHKAKETASKLESLAKTFVATISDPAQQAQLLAELESISKNGAPQMPGMTPPIMNAAAAAAAMQPHMMMRFRNPILSGASPRVGKGAPPNGNMHMQMQMQMAAQQAMAQQAMAQAMMQAHMFNGGLPMMAMPGMMPGMPPGMAGLPGMMPPSAAAMAAAAQAQMAAAAIAVSTPSRNPSTSGAASRTRTPLTASATNSPRPVTEPTIKEEDPPSMEAEAPVASAAAPIKQEENSTVAVA